VRAELAGDQLGVAADGVRGVHGEHAPADPADPLGQPAQQRGELGHFVGLRADQALGQHHRFLVGGRGQQVGHLPVGTDRAPHRLAVDRDRRQPARPGDGCADRADPGAGGQPGPHPVGQVLGLQQDKHPLDGVRVRRGVPTLGVAAAPERGQHLLAGRADPGGDVVQ
jgi:hypothetical protein